MTFGDWLCDKEEKGEFAEYLGAEIVSAMYDMAEENGIDTDEIDIWVEKTTEEFGWEWGEDEMWMAQEWINDKLGYKSYYIYKYGFVKPRDLYCNFIEDANEEYNLGIKDPWNFMEIITENKRELTDSEVARLNKQFSDLFGL